MAADVGPLVSVVISEHLAKQNIKFVLVESPIEYLNDRLVKSYCGENHTHRNAAKRFQHFSTVFVMSVLRFENSYLP